MSIDFLNDLLIHSPALREFQHEESKEQITLMDEVDLEENQEQFNLELSKTFENIEETKWESDGVKNLSNTRIFSKNQNSNNIKNFLISRNYQSLI